MTNPETIIGEVRSAIDEADTILLKALAARFRAVRHMRMVKKASGITVEDPVREIAMKDAWRTQAQDLEIPPELALLILDCVLIESKKIQSTENS